MYFSLIKPAEGHERAAVHQRLDGPYADHQWLWRWFPADAGSPRDFLFRRHEVDGMPRFYVVSHRKPADHNGDWLARTRDYAPQVESGERLQFELRANPTVRHGRDGKSKRHDVVMEAKKKLLAQRGFAHWKEWTDIDRPAARDLVDESCGRWLIRQGQAHGFTVDPDAGVVESCLQHRERPSESLKFTSVDFTGQLTVVNPALLQAALTNGIGHAKAFGCGLLLVRRLD